MNEAKSDAKKIKLKKNGEIDKRGQSSVANMSKARSVIKEALNRVKVNLQDTDSEEDEPEKEKTTKPKPEPDLLKVEPDFETKYATLFHQREQQSREQIEQKVREELKQQYEKEMKDKEEFYKEEVIKARRGVVKNMRHAMVLKF